MWNLQKEAQFVLKQIQDLGIEIENIRSFSIHPRRNMKRLWGLCKHIEPGVHEILINARLLSGDVDIHILRTLIAHEILHAAKGAIGHGKEWKRLGKIVENAYGYKIQTYIPKEQWDEVKSHETLPKDSGETRIGIPEGFKLDVGDYIQHKTFGDGVVIGITPMGNDAIVNINFVCGGMRQLMLKASAVHIKITKSEQE